MQNSFSEIQIAQNSIHLGMPFISIRDMKKVGVLEAMIPSFQVSRWMNASEDRIRQVEDRLRGEFEALWAELQRLSAIEAPKVDLEPMQTQITYVAATVAELKGSVEQRLLEQAAWISQVEERTGPAFGAEQVRLNQRLAEAHSRIDQVEQLDSELRRLAETTAAGFGQVQEVCDKVTAVTLGLGAVADRVQALEDTPEPPRELPVEFAEFDRLWKQETEESITELKQRVDSRPVGLESEIARLNKATEDNRHTLESAALHIAALSQNNVGYAADLQALKGEVEKQGQYTDKRLADLSAMVHSVISALAKRLEEIASRPVPAPVVIPSPAPTDVGAFLKQQLDARFTDLEASIAGRAGRSNVLAVESQVLELRAQNAELQQSIENLVRAVEEVSMPWWKRIWKKVSGR